MDIQTDILVRVAMKNGLVSEEKLNAAMRDYAQERRQNGEKQEFGDWLIAHRVVDLQNVRDSLHDQIAAKAVPLDAYEELDSQLQPPSDCLADFDDFSTIGQPAATPTPGGTPPKPVTPPDPMVGKTFGEYRIVQRLGADVAGVTYRAVFLKECRVVLLRILKNDSRTDDPKAVQEFIATVKRAHKLDHPKIQQIYSAGVINKQLYYSAMYIPGNSLRRELSLKGKLSALETINIALSVADALAYAHDKGIYHTQIDPSKIIIGTDDTIRIQGFGLGINALENLDWLANSLGDLPYYIAPEMATTGESRKFIGAATDIYSLGAVLFHCLTGTPPFHGQTLDEVLVDMYEKEHLQSRLFVDEIPPELAELVSQMMIPEPSKRVLTASGIIKRLRKIRNSLQAEVAFSDTDSKFILTDDKVDNGIAPTQALPPMMRQRNSVRRKNLLNNTGNSASNGESTRSRREKRPAEQTMAVPRNGMLIVGGIGLLILIAVIIFTANKRREAERKIHDAQRTIDNLTAEKQRLENAVAQANRAAEKEKGKGKEKEKAVPTPKAAAAPTPATPEEIEEAAQKRLRRRGLLGAVGNDDNNGN